MYRLRSIFYASVFTLVLIGFSNIAGGPAFISSAEANIGDNRQLSVSEKRKRARLERQRKKQRQARLERKRKQQKQARIERKREQRKQARLERKREQRKQARLERKREQRKQARLERKRKQQKQARLERKRKQQKQARLERKRKQQKQARLERKRKHQRQARPDRKRDRQKLARLERKRQQQIQKRSNKQAKSLNRSAKDDRVSTTQASVEIVPRRDLGTDRGRVCFTVQAYTRKTESGMSQPVCTRLKNNKPIKLAWSHQADDVIGYRIFRGNNKRNTDDFLFDPVRRLANNVTGILSQLR